MLKTILTPGVNPHYKWHIVVRDKLAAINYPDSSFIIDLKPKNVPPVVNLFEVLEAFGFCDLTWSIVLLRMRELHNKPVTDVNPLDFTVGEKEYHRPVYSFYYINGTVAKGSLTDTWRAPGPSSTNSALLWDYHLKYFLPCMRQATPDVFLDE